MCVRGSDRSVATTYELYRGGLGIERCLFIFLTFSRVVINRRISSAEKIHLKRYNSKHITRSIGQCLHKYIDATTRSRSGAIPFKWYNNSVELFTRFMEIYVFFYRKKKTENIYLYIKYTQITFLSPDWSRDFALWRNELVLFFRSHTVIICYIYSYYYYYIHNVTYVSVLSKNRSRV